MTLQQSILIWLVGMVIATLVVGVIACRYESDRSWAAIVGPLWPAILVLGAIVGVFWLLTELGARIGRALQQKFSQ